MRNIVLALTILSFSFAGAGFCDYASGVAALKAKNYDDAITEFTSLIEELKLAGAEEDPQYSPYYLMLGQSLFKSGKAGDAVAPLKIALKLKSNDVGTQLLLGQAYYKGSNYKAAASTLGSVNLSSLPKSTQASVSKMLSVCYEKTGQSGLALAQMEKAAQLNPNDAAAQYNYGTHALGAGYTDDAVRALERAVALESRNIAKRRALVTALVRQGREARNRTAKQAVYVKAVASAQQLSKLEPSYDNFLQLAETQLGAQRYADAIGSLDRAMAKKSSSWLPYFYKGQALTALKSYSEALPPLESALGKQASANDKVRIYNQLGFVHEKLKAFAQSKAAYQKAGNSGAAARVAENESIANENQGIEAHNREIAELERQRKELEKQMQALPGAEAPPR